MNNTYEYKYKKYKQKYLELKAKYNFTQKDLDSIANNIQKIKDKLTGNEAAAFNELVSSYDIRKSLARYEDVDFHFIHMLNLLLIMINKYDKQNPNLIYAICIKYFAIFLPFITNIDDDKIYCSKFIDVVLSQIINPSDSIENNTIIPFLIYEYVFYKHDYLNNRDVRVMSLSIPELINFLSNDMISKIKLLKTKMNIQDLANFIFCSVSGMNSEPNTYMAHREILDLLLSLLIEILKEKPDFKFETKVIGEDLKYFFQQTYDIKYYENYKDILKSMLMAKHPSISKELKLKKSYVKILEDYNKSAKKLDEKFEKQRELQREIDYILNNRPSGMGQILYKDRIEDIPELRAKLEKLHKQIVEMRDKGDDTYLLRMVKEKLETSV